MRRLLALAITGALLGPLCGEALSQEPAPFDRGSAGLRQTLRRLASPFRVLHIVAHPDDEDSGTVTYLSRGLGVDVTIASITRGESGANLVTDDFFDRLGVLRTLEYRRAARYYGARLRFTRFADFGYSKSLEETLRNWDREEVLADLVRIVREERPHVILTRWRGDARDGHGHHQAAGLLAREAYAAAADPRRFPDAGEAWQARKLYSDNLRESDDWTVAIDAGLYNPLLGQTYAQLAREGMRAHRSQGAGAAIADPGPSPRYYKLEASEAGGAEREDSLFDRLDATLPPELREAVGRAIAAFDADHPEACLPALAQGLRAARRLLAADGDPLLKRRERLFERAVQQALGVRLDFLVEPEEQRSGLYSSFRPYETIDVVAPGQSLEASVRLYANGKSLPGRIKVHAPEGWRVEEAVAGRFRIRAAADAKPTSVHWRRNSVWDVEYESADPKRWSAALPPPAVSAEAVFVVENVPVHVRAPLEASFIDHERIQRRQPLAVGPPVSVSFPADAGVLPLNSDAYSVDVQLESQSVQAVEGELRLATPAGWRMSPEAVPLRFAESGERRVVGFVVTPPPGLEAGAYELRAELMIDGQPWAISFERIHYPGLETAYLSQPAVHQARAIDVQTAPDLEVGYVMGTGDAVPEAIRQLGADVTLLDGPDLASGDLSRFDIILLGIRAYAVREDLKAHNRRLLDYVEQGGVLVVQYNTPEFDNNYGPYPYSMGARPEEVSEEDAPVRILDPDRAVFAWPNRITERDFAGWVEQRGSKFLAEWDPRYEALLETQDSGQEPQRGGWLEARYGDGLYIYCAYAWYRQAPYAVPGAVRIFANLLSLGSPEAPWREE